MSIGKIATAALFGGSIGAAIGWSISGEGYPIAALAAALIFMWVDLKLEILYG